MTSTRMTAALSVLTEFRDGILVVTLNRPHARNAMNADMAEQVGDTLDRANHNPEVRVVILIGAGDTAFCAGGDLVAMSEGQTLEPTDPAKEAWGFGGVCRHPIDKPIIAAVNGFAVGGGAQIVLACDLVVADETAVFSFPEVGNGLVASSGAAVRLPAWLPRPLAMELLLLGRRFTVSEAHSWGLVNRVVPPGRALDEAFTMAEIIGRQAPLAVQATSAWSRASSTANLSLSRGRGNTLCSKRRPTGPPRTRRKGHVHSPRSGDPCGREGNSTSLQCPRDRDIRTTSTDQNEPRRTR